MKQKFSFLLFTIISVVLFSACSDDDNPKDKDYLPETARAFIDSRLGGYSILNIEEVDDKGNESNEKYVVTLSNDLLVSFSSMGYWRRIESSRELPEKLQQEISYDGAGAVKKKYPSKTINKMYFLPYFYKVVLNDDTSLVIYTDNGTDMKVGLDMYGKLAVNKNIYDFVLAYYANPGSKNTYEFFQEDEAHSPGYRFYISTGQTAYFDEDGDWYYLDGGNYSIYPIIYQYILPQELRDIIENKYKSSGTSVYRIIYHETYYQVLLKMDASGTDPFFILYDISSKTEIEPPKQAVLDFLNTYVGKPDKDMALTYVIKPDTKKTIYEFTGSIGTTKVMVMHMDLNGQVYTLTLNGSEIPRKILGYLPAAVKEYVEKNKPAEDIIVSVVNGMKDEYYIQFKSGGRVVYDKEGNVLN